MADAVTLIVLAKQPRPGQVKTRLQSAFTPEQAADLAAAALTDTLRVVRCAGAPHRLLAWDGCAAGWDDGFEVVDQPAGTLNDRLSAAFAAAFARHPEPALLIGMDTPQVTPELLDTGWGGADAVLGLSEDGGFWAIGLRPGHPPGIFDGVPMSTDRTGAAQLARLTRLGLRVGLLPPLVDVDEPADVERVAAEHPELCLARTHRAIVGARTAGPDRWFDRLHAGAAVPSGVEWDVGRWRADADPVDQLVVTRCEPPVIDLGCGPGRMVVALTESGMPAVGVDASRVAVELSRARGGPTLLRSLADPLPAEGRWGTVLLMDGNIGLGGDVRTLLARCAELLVPGGLIVAEVDPDRARDQLIGLGGSEGGRALDWVRIGIDGVVHRAADLGLLVVEEWSSSGRSFVALRSAR